jgi:hypothetical protein
VDGDGVVMTTFPLIHTGLDTAPMLAELDAQPELWDAFTERRTSPGSPHAEMTDIWCRTRARDDLADAEAFRLPYAPTFYPAWYRLPSIQPVVWSLMGMTRAVQLGNVLLTRLKPGARILPHVDRGWSVDWFSTKFYVVLRGGDGCRNICGEEVVCMPAGSIFGFENRVLHSVENDDPGERISLIVTMRVET